jgi:hypothetical protein
MPTLQATSELGRLPRALPPTNEPLRLAVRKMRWFRAAFEAYVQQVEAELGCRFELDYARLGTAFVHWLRGVREQKPSDRGDRRAFFDFAASLMAKELVSNMPVTASSAPVLAPRGSPGAFWPEGYVCTMFCLTVWSAIVDQEFGEHASLSPKVGELGFWWTYRENAFEEPRLSAGFFQAILGHQPDWTWPDQFQASKEQQDASP